VEQKGFEPSTPTSPFHRKIVREFGEEFALRLKQQRWRDNHRRIFASFPFSPGVPFAAIHSREDRDRTQSNLIRRSTDRSAPTSSNRTARSIRICRTLRQPWRGVSTCRCAGDSAQHAGENQFMQRKDPVPIRDSRQPDRIEYCRLPDR